MLPASQYGYQHTSMGTCIPVLVPASQYSTCILEPVLASQYSTRMLLQESILVCYLHPGMAPASQYGYQHPSMGTGIPAPGTCGICRPYLYPDPSTHRPAEVQARPPWVLPLAWGTRWHTVAQHSASTCLSTEHTGQLGTGVP